MACHGLRLAAWPLLALAALSVSATAQSLSDNLANPSSGTEVAAGSRWLAASFGTDSSTSTLTAVTLLLANPVPGAARVDLYTDAGLEPGSILGSLSSPATYPTELAEATFTTAGIPLDASTTYWVVLNAPTGELGWSWSADDTGTGVGFRHTWAVSDDAGSAWWSIDIYQTQMGVTAVTPCLELTWHEDADGDGHGALGSTLTGCEQPAGYVLDDTDCDDLDGEIFPANLETCDGKDNDCNSIVDDAAVPAGRPDLRVSKASGTTLSWTATSAAEAYDVLVGDLGELRSAPGDYATLSRARCLSDDLASTSLVTDEIDPPTGGATWILVRPANCAGGGTLDDGGAQVGSRDPEVAVGGYGCR